MKPFLARLFVLFFSLAAVAQSAAFSADAAAADKLPLRVLYVGSANAVAVVGSADFPAAERALLNAARAVSFREFLARHFTSVDACTGAEFTAARAQAAEVVVIDESPPGLAIRDVTRPMVLIGMSGMRSSKMRGSKFDWLCACLDTRLHSMRTDHPMFKGPLPVRPTLVDEVDPETGRPVRSWLVHEKMPGIPGMVVSAEHLLEAEDSEIISGGLNMKGDHGVALAREANLLLWGPAGHPGNMTAEAQRLFVNALVYMKQFDGAVQTVFRGKHARTAAFEIAKSPNVTREDRYLEWISPEALQLAGGDKKKLAAAFEGNEPWLYVPAWAPWLVVDEDAKSLGVPNHDVRLLEKGVALLDDPAQAAKGRRLLERYTGLAQSDAAAWRGWFTQNRDALYFSDRNGYRFFTGPAGPGPAQELIREAIAKLPAPETSESSPVAIAAAAVGPSGHAYARVGDPITVVVRLTVRDGWHTYESVPAGNPMVTTALDLALPPGARWIGEWRASRGVPEKKGKDAATGVVEQRGEVFFVRAFYHTAPPAVGPAASRRGGSPLRGTLRLQACDDQRCLEPVSLPVEARLSLSGR